VSNATTEILQQYYTSLTIFLGFISKCRVIDLDKTIITSPLVLFITYSLGDALQFLITHEHRHISQAIRVKEKEDFPR
jgi:hypothetical protein